MQPHVTLDVSTKNMAKKQMEFPAKRVTFNLFSTIQGVVANGETGK